MINIKNQILLNIKYIAKTALRWTSAFLAIWGFFATIFPTGDLLAEFPTLFCKALFCVLILLGIYAVIFIFCTICVLAKKKYSVLKINGNHNVYVQYDDIFSKKVINNPKERRNIIIPVNRCFDTLVDDDLISSATLHGKAMQKLYDDEIFTQESLNDKIQSYLEERKIASETISNKQKQEGNLKRYPVGTVAEVKISDELTYFFLGLTTFDKDLKANVTLEDYSAALVKLLDFCDTRSQGFPVVMGLIGAGLSRSGIQEKDILSYIVSLIRIQKNKVHGDIHIVVNKNSKSSLAIAGL